MRGQARRLVEGVATVPRLLRPFWSSAPRWSPAWFALLAVQGVLPAATIYLTKLSVDSLTPLIGAAAAWEEVRPALVLALATAGLLLLSEALQVALDWLRAAQAEYVQDHIAALLQRQSLALDIGFYEAPEQLNLQEQARSEAAARSRALLESLGALLQHGISLAAMLAILLTYGLWLPLVLLASTLPALGAVLVFDRRYHRWWQSRTPDRRRAQYYDLLMTNDAAAGELRAFDLGELFQSRFRLIRERLRDEHLRQLGGQSLARFGAGLLALLLGGAAMAWMLRQSLLGLATIGDLVLLFQAFQRGQGMMRALMGSAGQIFGSALYLGNLFAFLDLRPAVVDPPGPAEAPARIREGIRFNDVTFRYPGSARPAVQQLSLTLPAGRVVAIVGPNGAGKTTLVKLLLRFYDVEEGSITVDGIDLRDLALRDLRRLSTVLFQFPIRYHLPAAENIAVGDRQRPATPEALEAAARGAGAHDLIAGLPEGYGTHLSKLFGPGVELSGGQWQRIATARAYFRESPVIILDEPTSAMDSWAEADWFARLQQLARGRTSLVITHRFTIAMRADIIHVMDGGRIVESGTHAELLALKGLYARSWAAQVEASREAELAAG